MSVWFLRHGESETNAQGLFAGSAIDSPLTLRGRCQSLEAARLLPPEISWIVSSPLCRAFETAKLVRDTLNLEIPIDVDARVTEWDMGSMSGSPVREINFDEWVSVYSAEDPQAFTLRVTSAVEDLGRRDGSGLLVSHGGVARAYVASREGLAPREMGKVLVALNRVPFKLEIGEAVGRFSGS